VSRPDEIRLSFEDPAVEWTAPRLCPWTLLTGVGIGVASDPWRVRRRTGRRSMSKCQRGQVGHWGESYVLVA